MPYQFAIYPCALKVAQIFSWSARVWDHQIQKRFQNTYKDQRIAPDLFFHLTAEEWELDNVWKPRSTTTIYFTRNSTLLA